MAKIDKLNNMLKFYEYDHLPLKRKSTKYTEVGGYAINEHHLETKKEKIKFIKENLKHLSSSSIDKIYRKLEKKICKCGEINCKCGEKPKELNN